MSFCRAAILLIGLFCLACSEVRASDCTGVPPPRSFTLDSVFTFQVGTSGSTDCWGWEAEDGTEYALFGVAEGIAILNTTTMEYVTTVPGPTETCDPYRWRDIKTYRHYCYAVSECNGPYEGLMIIDLQYLPDSVHFVGSYNPSIGFSNSHNLTIDTATGFAYVQMYANIGGFRIVSLADPEAPVDVDSLSRQEVHDLFARNDTLWVAEGTSGSFSIWDVSDKHDPSLIVRVTLPNAGYMHNIWPSEVGPYIATTEETPQKRIKIWDASDLTDIHLIGDILGPDYIAHNALLMGDYMIVSHYSGGVFVADLSAPACPREVARFDTYDGDLSDPYVGCWGVYPYTRSGRIYGSNTDGNCSSCSRISASRASVPPRVSAGHLSMFR